MTSHRTDLLSLFAGLLFVVVGVLTLTGGMPWLLEGQWLLPGALIALGIGVLLTVLGSGGDATDEPEPADDAASDPTAVGDEPTSEMSRQNDDDPPHAPR